MERESLVNKQIGEINQIANILAPCLRLEKPSNLFIYGKTGTGKTVSVKYTTNQILNAFFFIKIKNRF